MTSDGLGHTFNYDQENRLTGAAGYAYVYDADGNRVEKVNGTTGTLYWYMTPGIVAESDLLGTLKSEYIFFGGERVARRDLVTPTGVFYYFSDHLKTASVITDAMGNITAESDYYPWGGELQFVNADSNHYKFTGKERDSESSLDYFGARYYSNGLGRLISADWSATPVPVPYADFGDPQSLNLFTYVRNVPSTKYDADGHDIIDPTRFVQIAEAVGTVIKVSVQVMAAQSERNTQAVVDFLSNPPPPPAHGLMMPGLCTCAPRADQQKSDNKKNNNSRSDNQQEKGGAGKTEHGQERAEQARTGDAHRDVGDANRTIQEGKQYTDSKTGNNVSVRGNRVVVTNEAGDVVTQFKNSKANTQQRIEDGRWVPKPKLEEPK